MHIQLKSSSFIPVSELKWLFFDLNSYFASVEQQENPDLRGRPVAVVPMMTNSTCAIAASYEAKACGVKTGTKIYEARQLCPDLVCVLARHDLYVRYHHRILAELEQHIPVTKICSIDEAACRLFKNECSPDKAYELALRIKAGFKRNIGEAITCSIGIAPNAYLAKIGTELEKPDGLVILEPGRYAERLFTLDLTDLTGINRRMQERLKKAGIETIEQLWHTPPKQVRKIWGSVGGERLWYRLHGYEIPELETQRRVVGHSRVLDPALREPAKAYSISRQLILKAAARLRRQQLHGKRFVLSIRTVDKRRWANEHRLVTKQDNFVFVKALSILWESMSQDLRPVSIKTVSVSIYDLYDPTQITFDLFTEDHDKQNIKEQLLTKTMDSINQRFGAGTIQLGLCPVTSAGYVGTKIAFNRIPDQAEFNE